MEIFEPTPRTAPMHGRQSGPWGCAGRRVVETWGSAPSGASGHSWQSRLMARCRDLSRAVARRGGRWWSKR